jgi:hypothetical protein
MPRLVKVGFTLKEPKLRAQELDHTGSPHPYTVAYSVCVEGPKDVEAKVHEKLSSYREGKEWFSCSVDIAISKILAVAGERLYGENFYNTPTDNIKKIRKDVDAEYQRRLLSERHQREQTFRDNKAREEQLKASKRLAEQRRALESAVYDINSEYDANVKSLLEQRKKYESDVEKKIAQAQNEYTVKSNAIYAESSLGTWFIIFFFIACVLLSGIFSSNINFVGVIIGAALCAFTAAQIVVSRQEVAAIKPLHEEFELLCRNERASLSMKQAELDRNVKRLIEEKATRLAALQHEAVEQSGP